MRSAELLYQYPRQESNICQKRRENHKEGDEAAQNAAQIPSDLSLVIKAWPNLQEAIRAGIIAMIRAAGM